MLKLQSTFNMLNNIQTLYLVDMTVQFHILKLVVEVRKLF